jgi:hypothetical protein
MGRKRRVTGDEGDKTCEWESRAGFFLREVAECLEQRGVDVVEHILETAARNAALRAASPATRVAAREQRTGIFESVSEYEWAAWTVFRVMEQHCGEDESRRIFARLGKPRGETAKRWENQKLLLRLVEAKSISIRKLAKELAADQKLRANFDLSGCATVDSAERRFRALKKEYKKEREKELLA